MFMVNTIFKALFVEMYVKNFFVKLLVQRNEFNLCLKMVLYKSYLSIYLCHPPHPPLLLHHWFRPQTHHHHCRALCVHAIVYIAGVRLLH